MSNNMKRKKLKSVSQRRRINSADYNSLEQRLALTTFVVTSLGDGIANDGLVTVREAIVAANTNASSGDAAAGEATGDIIRFNSSLAGGTINLTEGQLTILDDLAIQVGELNITVDAQGLSRAFEISGSETVSLGRINVTGGTADIGGGVLASGSGNLIVFGGEYSGNVATGVGGGAIYSASGNLNVSGGTIFDGNFATGDSGSGGAIYSDGGTASINGGSFTANAANRAGGAIELAGGELFLTDIEADGNIAGPDGFAAPGNGGAVHVTAGEQVVVTDSMIKNNFAAAEGGGLWNQAGTTLFVNGDTTFNNNTAAGDGADEGGGAIFNNGGDVFVNGGSFNDNGATGTAGSGGAIFSVDGRVLVQAESEFSNNLSSRAGGAVELIDGEFFDTRSTYTANDTGVSQPASPGNGGAFHITGTGTVAFNGTRFVANAAGSEGGAVWGSADSTSYLTDAIFTDNVASGNDADNGGGAIFNNGGDLFVNGGAFDDNIADGTSGSGGAIFSTDGKVLVYNEAGFSRNFSARAGGAVEIVDGEFFDSDSQYFRNNAGVTLTASPGNGAAVHISGSATSTFSGSGFRGNLANRDGGAVWNAAGATMFLTNVVITENFAGGNDLDSGGGGIFNNGGSVFVNNSSISNNEASGISGSGGGAFSNGGVLRFDNSRISDNGTAGAGELTTGNGGGVAVNGKRAPARLLTVVIG